MAVLYFAARDTADLYRAEGLTEDIATLLGRVANVEVKSPSLVRRARPAAQGDLRALGRSLGVRYLVEGSVRRTGARLHVTVRLVEARTGVTAWGDAYDRAEEEMLVLPAVIAREAAGRVSGEAAGSDRAAYAHAVARVQEARVAGVGGDSLVRAGLELADRALRLDSTASDAWMARGFLLAFANPRTMAGARESFERAVAADPRNAEAHHQYAQILNWLGDHAQAERELRTALALEPGRAVSLIDLASCVRQQSWPMFKETGVITGPRCWRPFRPLRIITALNCRWLT